jgi:putative drug exporter of the RND superfamily
MTIQTQRLPMKWLRILLPSILIIVWVALSAIGGPYFGKISQVASNDQATFLPESAESTKVNELSKDFQETNSIPAIIVFAKDNGSLSQNQLGAIEEASRSLQEIDGIVGGVSPPVTSDNKQAAFIAVNVSPEVEYKEFLPLIRERIDESSVDVPYKITGPVGFLGDLSQAFSGIDGLLLIVALTVVFIILLIVYRSPILPFLVLLSAISALAASILVVWHLANIDVIEINGQVQGILFILVIGAATDYSLLFVSRYREELERHASSWQSIIAALKGSFEPILAAGGTVIVGLLCLLLSDLNSNKALGPVGSIGIIFALLSALTFLPSLLLPFGRKVFWPRMPKYHVAKEDHDGTNHHGLWKRIGSFVARYPRRIWIVCTAVLLLFAIGIIGLRADGISQSDIVLGKSEAREGQQLLNEYFPGGSGTPAQIIVSAGRIDQVVRILDNDNGVSAVQAVADSPSGTVPVGNTANELEQTNPFASIEPRIVDNRALLQATLRADADSKAAQDVIVHLRSELQQADQQALVGGITATQLDTNNAAKHDRAVVIPTVLVVITIILMVLLRSITAPLILLLTTVLSFAATLGVASLLFNNVFGFPNSDPSVVLYGFIFLVALGIDYNIFLMTRVREESLKIGTKKGVVLGLIVTGGVITSAGIVLAATFAALAVIPVLFLVQLAFIVAFGVLLDTTLVRSLLVPAVIHDIGKRAWWPSKHIDN